MDAEREREIRDLAARLIASKRHRKIGLVLGDLLAEIDLLRQDELPTITMDDAMKIMDAYHASVIAEGRGYGSGVSAWREAALAMSSEYAECKSPGAV